MEVITFDINYNRPDKFYLYPFFDTHLGSGAVSENALKEKVRECANKGRYGLAIGGGDWMDCITSKDKRWSGNGLADWVERSNIVDSQKRRCEEIFRPLKEEGQLICIGTGNHEESIHRIHDNDITRNLCRDMDIPYAGYQTYIELRFIRAHKKTHSLIIHSWHGSGAAQSEGARIMRLVRLVNDIEADIYLMGHLHAMTSHTPDRLVLRNGKIKSIKLAATICGSWVKTYNQPDEERTQDPSYGEEKGYKPSRIGMPIIRIEPENHNDPYNQECVIES